VAKANLTFGVKRLDEFQKAESVSYFPVE
jgi:hypothetical protein